MTIGRCSPVAVEMSVLPQDASPFFWVLGFQVSSGTRYPMSRRPTQAPEEGFGYHEVAFVRTGPATSAFTGAAVAGAGSK